MDKIKDFFDQKKLDRKFKKAGSGHSLSQTSRGRNPSVVNSGHGERKTSQPRVSVTRSEESQLAGQAALMRLEHRNQPASTLTSSAAKIKAQVNRELKEEETALARAQAQAQSCKVAEKQFESAPVLPCILLICPFCSESIPKVDIDHHMHECLKQQLADNPSVVSVTMFISCNRNPEKLSQGKEVFLRIFNNIISNPGEEKYQKLRCSTKAYQERIQPMLGCDELLQAAGFTLEDDVSAGEAPANRQWVCRDPNVDLLGTLVSMLSDAQPMKPQLDRQSKILTPKQLLTVGPIVYPDDFYNLSKEEIAREHSLRKERAEKELQLRTKAMRERDALQEVRKYNYTLIRIRFPDNSTLQMVFRVYEKFGDVIDYLKSNLAYEAVPFRLQDAMGTRFEEDKFLSDLALVPAAMLNFHWDEEVLRDFMACQPEECRQNIQYLSDEFLARVQYE